MGASAARSLAVASNKDRRAPYSVSITGTAGIGNVLTAVFTSPFDGGLYNIQWVRGDTFGGGGSFVNISGATAGIYTQVADDSGYTISVRITNNYGATLSSNTKLTSILDLSSGGTFARALVAYYFTQAPTTGGSSFKTTATSGTRRSADARGDGIGASLLMEKAATNYETISRALSGSGWTAGTATVTANQDAGPDGATLADRVQATTQFSPYQNAPGPAGRVVASCWVRAVSGTTVDQLCLLHSSGSFLAAKQVAPTTTYQRVDCTGSATTNSGIMPHDSANHSGIGGGAGGTCDAYLDLHQLEAGYYPTSEIVTTSGSVTRPADTLSYTTGNYDASVANKGVKIVFAPDASSAEILAANETWYLIESGTLGDYIKLYVSGGAVNVELGMSATTGGSTAKRAITFSRGQQLEITGDVVSGTITVKGATTGDGSTTTGGTPFVWDGAGSRTVYIGGDRSGTSNVTGRFVNAKLAAN